MYRLGKLIPLETYAMSQPKNIRWFAFLRQSTLHSVISDLDKVIEFRKLIKFAEGTWINTDDLGSGYDTRYRDVSWMDTRDLQAKPKRKAYV